MKQLVFTFALLFVGLSHAQNIFDGLRYSQDRTLGSARFAAMGGTFGALGGETAAIGSNPAASSVFIRNRSDITLSVYGRENSSTYFGSQATGDNSNFTIGQAGAVFVFGNANTAAVWNKFTVGLNYNVTNGFDDTVFINGNSNNTIASFFLEQAQGVPLNLLETQGGESIGDLYDFLGGSLGVFAQNALLGFQGFIINPVSNSTNNVQYTSAIAGNRFSQDYVLLQKGYNGKYTFNFAAQYKNNFNVGFNLNSHVIDYRRSTLLTERNNSPNSTVNYVFFENNLNTLGSGFSAQIGAIAKLPGALRIGLTYDTPVWYTIAEETSQYLETDRTENGQTITTVVNPNVVNVFADYRLRTPARLGASAAYVFGAHGLLSFDYSYKDYSGITFGPGNDASFSALNVAIENNLKPVSTYSIGGEYRAGNFSLRAGLRHEESPFADGATVGGLTGYSAGLGYNFGNYSFDASYSHAEQDRNEQLYTIGLTAPARVAARYDSVLFTLGISL